MDLKLIDQFDEFIDNLNEFLALMTVLRGSCNFRPEEEWPCEVIVERLV